MKVLGSLGYDKVWLAWIPYGVYYACADVVTGQDEKVKLFGSYEVPALVFLGCTYAKMYARLENKQESETQAIGCVFGFIPIIAVVKFFMYK